MLALLLAVAASLTAQVAVAGSAASRSRRGAAAPVSLAVAATETTADLSLALTPISGLAWSRNAPSGVPVVAVNDAVRYQTVKGVGAAMTDSSACLIYKHLARRRRRRLMRALFGRRGLRLSFLRVPIGASDFTCRRRPYSYDNLPPGRKDPKLRHFSIRHDESYIIPELRAALALNPAVFVLGSLWSPPGWMKANGRMDNLNGAGSLLSTSYKPLAEYFVKFLQAYARDGIHINAITPQNEPGVNTAYPGEELSEANEAALIRDLQSAFARARIRAGIYGYDLGWDPVPLVFAQQLAAGPAAGDLAGIATHCYFGSPTSISTLHDQSPGLDEIVSECSPGIATLTTSELEISSIRNWASAVALWNLALDRSGGPVQPPNSGCHRCTGVVTINRKTRTWSPTIDYYQLGQFAKFVTPGAVRIDTPAFVTYKFVTTGTGNVTPGLDDVAFQNPDGTDALIAYNTATAPITFAVRSPHGRYLTYTLPPAATITLTWDGRA